MKRVWNFILGALGIKKKRNGKQKDASIYPMF